MNGYGTLFADVFGENFDLDFGKLVIEIPSNGEWQSSIIHVKCECVSAFVGKHVVCTLPFVVLKSGPKNYVELFEPALSDKNRNLIASMCAGLHNNFIIKFRPADVFWPPNLLYFNCLHPFIEFNDLHSISKTGVLLVHIFGADKRKSPHL